MKLRSPLGLGSLLVIGVALSGACGEDKKPGSGSKCGAIDCACTESDSCDGDLVCDAASKKCRTGKTCAQLTCVTNQLCGDGTGKADAHCLPECEAGFHWNGTTDTCDVEPPSCAADAANSILATCDAENRDCVETSGVADCGGCKATAIDVSGVCEIAVTCTELSCSTLQRACEELPNGHCTACLAGFVEDSTNGTCRVALTCSDITCPGGDFCVQPPTTEDAYCITGGCGSAAVLGADGICHACPPCDNASIGEAGPYLTGLSGEGRCICTTAPGYFWREGLFPGVTPCDADQDGWVRESARNAMQSTNAAILTNARCAVREVDRFILEAEDGSAREVPLLPTGTTVQLYETERNDDQALVDRAVTDGDLPVYGAGGRVLLAKELNSLSKACFDGQVDVNENNLADVNEWHGNTALASVTNYLKPFVDFAYFIELHRSWYQAPATGTGPGTYHIREKSRSPSALAGTKIQLAYDAGAGSFWQSCSRFRDSDYLVFSMAGTSQQGMDFARVSADPGVGWLGMNHHSQFKCVRVVDRRGAPDPPHWLTPALFASDQLNYTANACRAAGLPAAPPIGVDAINPWDPSLECSTVDPTTLSNGDVLFVSVNYTNYESVGGHVRGCVNECMEFVDRCPGWDPDPVLNTAQCEGDTNNFGKLYCGCGFNYGGDSCDYGCPGDPSNPGAGVSNLFVDPGFGFSPSRTGYWLCGTPTGTSYVDPTAPWLGDASIGYRIQGEIPMTRPTGGWLCENAGDCNNGYAIR